MTAGDEKQADTEAGPLRKMLVDQREEFFLAFRILLRALRGTGAIRIDLSHIKRSVIQSELSSPVRAARAKTQASGAADPVSCTSALAAKEACRSRPIYSRSAGGLARHVELIRSSHREFCQRIPRF